MAATLGDEGFFARSISAVAVFREEGKAVVGILLVVLGVRFVVVPVRHDWEVVEFEVNRNRDVDSVVECIRCVDIAANLG